MPMVHYITNTFDLQTGGISSFGSVAKIFVLLRAVQAQTGTFQDATRLNSNIPEARMNKTNVLANETQ